MRLSSILTLVFALAALVLSLLALFAGSTRTFLQSGDILTLNVSRIGQGDAFNTSDGDGGIIDSFINNLEGHANDLISEAADEVADALNLTDFYSVHVMNYCDGFFKGNATEKHPGKNITYCSSKKALFHFNPTRIVEDSLPSQVSLDDINWPKEIQDASNAIRVAAIVMFIFFVVGIAFAGFAAIGAIVTIFSEGRLAAMCNFLLDVVSLSFLLPFSC